MPTSRTSFSILNVVSYVEKLIKHKEWLASVLQELYHRLQILHGWTGPPPAKLVSGLPHVHSILDGLGVLTSDEEDKKDAADHKEDTEFALRFSTAPKAKENFHNLTFASNTLSPATSVGRDCEQPTDEFPSLRRCQRLQLKDFRSLIQHTSQGKMHQDGGRELFSLQQGWNTDPTQALLLTQMYTEEYTPFPHMPWRSDSNLLTTCVQTSTEQCDIRVQQSPLDPEHGLTIQLGQQMDYFSLGMEYPTDVSSVKEFFADFDKVLEDRLFC
jgi:hypothetical protein